MLRDYISNPIKITKNGVGSEMPFKEDLYYLYINCNKTITELMEYFNVKQSTLLRWLKKYNIHKSQKLKLQKITETCIKKYGKTHYNNREKSKETCIKKYGVTNVSKNIEIQKKKYITMKKNGSYGASKEENQIFNYLTSKYTDVIRQYKSKEYPFQCDFYIPSINTYIEYQGFFTHGSEPYIGTVIQNKKIEKWKLKNSIFYKNAIKNWTETDVKKRMFALNNKLNWFEFFSLEEFIKWFEKQ